MHILADPRLASLVYQPEERPQGPLAPPFFYGQVRPHILKLGGGYLPTRSEATSGSGPGGGASASGALALWGYLLCGRHLLSERYLLAMTDFGKGAPHDHYELNHSDQTHMGDGYAVPALSNGGWDDGSYSPCAFRHHRAPLPER